MSNAALKQKFRNISKCSINYKYEVDFHFLFKKEVTKFCFAYVIEILVYYITLYPMVVVVVVVVV